MKITQHELEQIMHEQLLKQIHIMYDIHLENYAVLPEVHEEVRHKRDYAAMTGIYSLIALKGYSLS